MKILISYGKQFELRRVKNTLKKLDWYNKQNYPVSLPEGITKNSPDELIRDMISKEYNPEKFFSEVYQNVYKLIILS